MNEKINHTTLIYDDYKGADLYCDGDIEQHLLDLVKQYESSEYENIIETNANWPIMYHLSYVRENILRWYPFKKHASILEIGSGCGAVSGSLCASDRKVTCIELSKQRSLINAYRHKEEELQIHVGNFEDIQLTEKFDYVTLIGVLEYGGSYIHSKNPYVEFLKKARSYLKPDGKVLIAIENKMGLKYWAGCKEDHVGRFFESIEGYPNTKHVRTFTKKELTQLLNEAGLSHHQFYYPYPDYKFAHTIYSDRHLPKRNECNDNKRNFDQDRMELFHETKVFNTLIENELFPEFANSFFVEASSAEGCSPISYAKFSQSNRAREFQVKTMIQQEEMNTIVRKEAIHEAGIMHVQHMMDHAITLKEQYQSTELNVANCFADEGAVQFEYVEGICLEDYLNHLAAQGDYKKMLKEMDHYFDLLCKPAKEDRLDLQNTAIFKEMPAGKMMVLEHGNLDALFSNVKKQETGYMMFDYEWVLDQAVPVDFVKYRCLFYFSQHNPYLGALDLYPLFGIDEEKRAMYEQMEADFQNYVRKGKLVDDQLCTKLGQSFIAKEELINYHTHLQKANIMQVYLDKGSGYSENDSMKLTIQRTGNHARITFALTSEVKRVRIDPMDTYGIVHIEKLYAYHPVQATSIDLKYETNGKSLGQNHFLYLTEDPVIELGEVDLSGYQIVAEFELWPLEEDLACWLSKQLGSRKFLKGR